MKSCKIDDVNANILRALMSNARTSFTEMAKANKTTVSALRSRYLNLEKAGVINGSMMLVNPQVIGFNCFGFLGLKVHPKNLTQVHAYLSKQPYILSAWPKMQEINIGSFFAMPNLEYFKQVTDELKGHSHIKTIQPHIHVGVPFNAYPENLIISTNNETKQHDFCEQLTSEHAPEKLVKGAFKKRFIETPQLLNMDPVDREIAKILSHNARVPFSYIAKQLNKSTSYIISRYDKFRENGLFAGSSIRVNLKKLGYQANAMVYVTTSIGTSISDVHRRILGIPNVILLVKIIGDCDIMAVVPLRSFKDLFQLEKRFRAIEGIEKIQINVNPPFDAYPVNFFTPLF